MLPRALHLPHAHLRRRVRDLPVQVRHLDRISVHQPQRPDPRRRQVCGSRTPQAAHAHDQDPRSPEPQLPVQPHLLQDHLPSVAPVLLILQRPRALAGRRRWPGTAAAAAAALAAPGRGCAAHVLRALAQHGEGLVDPFGGEAAQDGVVHQLRVFCLL